MKIDLPPEQFSALCAAAQGQIGLLTLACQSIANQAKALADAEAAKSATPPGASAAGPSPKRRTR